MKCHMIMRDIVVARELFPAWKILRKILSYSVSRKERFKFYVLRSVSYFGNAIWKMEIDRDIDGARHGLLIHV